ncbi:hypothetical protein [Rhodanobacter sp. DHG33]|uniref:hypothetical protein n=1 Tax=Rhodanobacter sp. DHG33 TaxID=2775921 RepID=UPI0019B19061|nr:hypothetical protein [Rhodanobacter sp. DHG33]MBD8898261.1 hypothetical protein [Rhodanobacter sp. DHG33]
MTETSMLDGGLCLLLAADCSTTRECLSPGCRRNNLPGKEKLIHRVIIHYASPIKCITYPTRIDMQMHTKSHPPRLFLWGKNLVLRRPVDERERDRRPHAVRRANCISFKVTPLSWSINNKTFAPLEIEMPSQEIRASHAKSPGQAGAFCRTTASGGLHA